MILRRLQRFLRASLLAMLVLGLVGTPILRSICEVHSLQHAWLAALNPQVVHFEGDRDDPGDQGQSGSKHTHAASWHEGGSPAFTPVVPLITFVLLHPPRIALPPMTASVIASPVASSPFRPPIA